MPFGSNTLKAGDDWNLSINFVKSWVIGSRLLGYTSVGSITADERFGTFSIKDVVSITKGIQVKIDEIVFLLYPDLRLLKSPRLDSNHSL